MPRILKNWGLNILIIGIPFGLFASDHRAGGPEEERTVECDWL
jgi:hypothetical protein